MASDVRYSLLFVALVFLSIVSTASSLSTLRERLQPIRPHGFSGHIESYHLYQSVSYSACATRSWSRCSGWWWGHECKDVYYCDYQQRNIVQYSVAYRCQSGWTPYPNCNIPICSNCIAGTTCIAPNNCTDIDECALGTSGCAHMCVNTHGSFSCRCNSGYALDANGRTCNAICSYCIAGTTCTAPNTCSFSKHVESYHQYQSVSYSACVTRSWSSCSGWWWGHECRDVYYCEYQQRYTVQYPVAYRCQSGWKTYPNCNIPICSYCAAGTRCTAPNTCTDIDECASRISRCSHTCVNTHGSFSCGCNPGYALDANGRTCNDTDECTCGTSECSQLCINSFGNYTCDCLPGYSLAEDERSCNDIDECSFGTSGCSHHCINGVGNYTCDCCAGYTLADDERTCNDIDECTSGTSNCSQQCTNGLGNYTCDCRPGYSLTEDERSCSDIDHPRRRRLARANPVQCVTDDDIRAITYEIWRADRNRFPDDDVEYNVRFVRGRQKFFTRVDEERLNDPTGTYAKMIALFDNYKAFTGIAETCGEHCRNEEDAFLDAILDTRPIQLAHQWLIEKGLSPPSTATFKVQLRQYWFINYSRSGRSLDSSGFEHTFVGEIDTKFGRYGEDLGLIVKGLHNWVRMYLEEQEGRLSYRGFINRCEPSNGNFQLLEFSGFDWKPIQAQIFYRKSISSVFIGTSPEVEIALSTVCLLARFSQNSDENCPIQLERNQLTMMATSWFQRGQTISSAYPIC